VSNAIFVLIVIFLISYHWTLYGSRIIQSFMLLFSSAQRDRTRELISAMEGKLSAFITGQAILCLVIGTLALIAYLIIGLPNALVLAVIAGVLEAVPVVGPALGAVPAGMIALSIDPSKLWWVIIASVLIQAAENYLLVPRIMRRAVGVNPFVSLLSLFAFSSLIGIVGALLAIPIAAIIQLLMEYFVFDSNANEPEPSTGRDYVSRLRYEAQELIIDVRKQARHRRGGSDNKVKQVDQLMDEIEAITSDLDSVLAHEGEAGTP
jgi:predicted PurR-regulated permease PerM